MLNKNKAYMIIDKVLSFCNGYTMVTVKDEEEGVTRYTNSEIHQNSYYEDIVVTIQVFKGKRISTIKTNILSDEGLKQAVCDAEENLELLPEGEIEIPEVLEPAEICQDTQIEDLNKIYDIRSRAERLKEQIDMLDIDYLAAGVFALSKMNIAMGNNRGIKRFSPLESLHLDVLITHKSGETGFAQCFTNHSAELNIKEVFEKAYKKAKMSINKITIERGCYTVILEPMAVGRLLDEMSYCAFSAKGVKDGTSFLTGKQGQKVFGENITIIDDPHNTDTFPFSFDYEGYERKKLNIIDKGIAIDVAYDVRSALKNGVETTGHASGNSGSGGTAENMIMENGEDTMEGLIKSTGKGILVTKLNYMNMVDTRQGVFTGLTRDGTFLIEDGKIKCGIKDMRFTESIANVFNNVVGITDFREKTPAFLGVSYVPALKVTNFHFTGNTELKEVK